MISENASRKPNRQIPIFSMCPEAKSKEGFDHDLKTPKFANKTPITNAITGEAIRSFKLLIVSAITPTEPIKKSP